MDWLQFAQIKHKKILFTLFCLFGLIVGLFLLALPVYKKNQQIELRISQLEQKNESLLNLYQTNYQKNIKLKQLTLFKNQIQIESEIKKASVIAKLEELHWQQGEQPINFKTQLNLNFFSSYAQFLLFLEQLSSQKQAQIEQFSIVSDPLKKGGLTIQMLWNIYVF